jgi:WD40 repeat protein
MNRATWGLISLAAVGFALPLCGPLRGADPPAARTDSLGDPLPPGAVLRLGTTRLRHLERVTSLSFTPDGTALVSTDREAVRVWEVATGKELFPVGETGQSTNCAVLSPRTRQAQPALRRQQRRAAGR